MGDSENGKLAELRILDLFLSVFSASEAMLKIWLSVFSAVSGLFSPHTFQKFSHPARNNIHPVLLS